MILNKRLEQLEAHVVQLDESRMVEEQELRVSQNSMNMGSSAYLRKIDELQRICADTKETTASHSLLLNAARERLGRIEVALTVDGAAREGCLSARAQSPANGSSGFSILEGTPTSMMHNESRQIIESQSSSRYQLQAPAAAQHGDDSGCFISAEGRLKGWVLMQLAEKMASEREDHAIEMNLLRSRLDTAIMDVAKIFEVLVESKAPVSLGKPSSEQIVAANSGFSHF